MRTIAIAAGLAAAAAAAALVLWIFDAELEGSPGFIGPGALIADVVLALHVLLLAGLTFGFYLARRGRIEAHRVNQTIWVLVNAVLVVLVMVPSMQDVKVESVGELADLRKAVSWLHAAAGALTVAAGLWLVLQMNDILPARLHIRGWKRLMRLTLAGYWAVALGGLAMYFLWYAG